MPKDVTVLIVDDSPLVREALARELRKYAGIKVVGTAPDPFVARDRILELRPDVVTVDVEMPKMDGISFVRRLMKFHPIPAIMVSSVTERGTRRALEALDAGAFDVLAKPDAGRTLADIVPRLVELIRAAGAAELRPATARAPLAAPAAPRPIPAIACPDAARRVVAIGTSTGGTEALRVVLTALPPTCPGIVMVQHMPEGFTKSFAERLDTLCAIEVREAVDRDVVKPGLALLAPGNRQMRLVRNGNGWSVKVFDGPRVCRHKPSVDVLFESTAEAAGADALGVIMTGMGADGAAAMLKLRNSGAMTIAQDEATCVVFGMPREAIALGAARQVAPLPEISARIVEWAISRRAAAA